MRNLFLIIHFMGIHGRRTMSCLSVTMNAQLRLQFFTFSNASLALSDFIMFSKLSSLMLPIIHSSPEPLQGDTLPQGSMKKKSVSAPHGGR